MVTQKSSKEELIESFRRSEKAILERQGKGQRHPSDNRKLSSLRERIAGLEKALAAKAG